MIPRIRSAQIRNYKSLAEVSVELDPLTILVGPNGVGKSNFLDALSFVQQCLAESIGLAFRSRGGISAVRRRGVGPPRPIGIRLVLDLADDGSAEYMFEIDPIAEPGFRVVQERCSVKYAKETEVFEFVIRDGVFSTPIPGIRPRVSPNRLALYAASATEEFLPVFDFLTSMHFYAIAPERIRKLQEPDPGEFLKPDGSNAAAILRRLQSLQSADGDVCNRLCELLSVIAEGVTRVEHRSVGQMETLTFKQHFDDQRSFDFDALNMSDGTLRLLGLLLAIYQPAEVSVVGIEEPEATVHPGVMELVTELLIDAANEKQVIVTTQSPELLELKTLNDQQIRAVASERGDTLIAPLTTAARTAIRDRLFSAGELLRAGQLEPDLEANHRSSQDRETFRPLQTKE